jgi:hypothetical protein
VLREVVVDRRGAVPLAVGEQRVVGPAGDRHPRVRRLVAEDVAVAVLPVHHGLEHALGEGLGLSRVERDRAVRRRVLVDAVLAVQDLAGDEDRGVGVEEGDLVLDRRQVAVGEGDHPA